VLLLLLLLVLLVLLQVLDFKQGRTSGSLSAEWGQMTRLKELHLTGNWITGKAAAAVTVSTKCL
jgi:hypothetical protein